MGWPACIVIGNGGPETANPAPARLTEVMVSACAPDAVKVRGLVELVFNGTAPKARIVPLTAKWAAPEAEWTTYPPQPDANHTMQSIAKTNDDAQRLLREGTPVR